MKRLNVLLHTLNQRYKKDDLYLAEQVLIKTLGKGAVWLNDTKIRIHDKQIEATCASGEAFLRVVPGKASLVESLAEMIYVVEHCKAEDILDEVELYSQFVDSDVKLSNQAQIAYLESWDTPFDHVLLASVLALKIYGYNASDAYDYALNYTSNKEVNGMQKCIDICESFGRMITHMENFDPKERMK